MKRKTLAILILTLSASALASANILCIPSVYNALRAAIAAAQNDNIILISEWDYPPLEVSDPMECYVRITPNTINKNSGGGMIQVKFIMFKGIEPEDIAEEPLTLYPGAIQCCKRCVSKTGRDRGYHRTIIYGSFDKTEVSKELTEGTNEITITGRFTTGQLFCGTDAIRVVDREKE